MEKGGLPKMTSDVATVDWMPPEPLKRALIALRSQLSPSYKLERLNAVGAVGRLGFQVVTLFAGGLAAA